MTKLQTGRQVSRPLILTLIFVALLFSQAIAFGQTDQARITGTVTDPNGAIVPGATVIAKNDKTGEERTATSSSEGTYLITALKPAGYTIVVNAANFANTKITNVQLSVGQELTLNLSVKTSELTASIDVAGGTEAAIDTGSARIGASVNEREVEGLPVNGRQLSQLYLQAPGSVNSGSGTFADIRFSGRANQQNVVRYDGIEGTAIIDASPGNLNGEVPTPFRLQSSLENVQEFRVDSSNFPAEYGTGTGGQINVVTKSGGNQFHGSVFEFLRNDAVDSRNFFDLTTKSPLRLNQFGGSVGGPIIKDKLFFFGSYEGYRLRSGINFVEAVPSAAARARAVPAILPLLDAFKAPQAVILPGTSASPDFDIAQLQATNTVNENAFAARFDYKPNANNSFYFRAFRDQGTNNAPEGVTGRRVLIKAVPQNAVFGYQSILKSTLINELRVGYNGAQTRINGAAPTVNGIDLSGITINISGSVANSGIAGQGSSSGVAIPGGLVRANSATNGRGQPYTPYSVSFVDSLNWIKGNHSYKFGGEVRLIRMYTDRQGGITYTFSNLNAFLANNPSSIQYLGDVSAPSPFTGGVGDRLAKQEYYIGYAQDEWKLRPNLTLNYGLRYEYYTPLREAQNRQILFDTRTGVLRPPTEQPYKSSKTNFGPRVALTWMPNYKSDGFFGGGKTVLRGGFGIYYGPGQTEDQIQAIESDRVSSTVSSGSLLAFPLNTPAVISSFTSNPLNRQFQPRAYSSDYQIPEKVYQYTVSLQQELPYNVVLTAAYVGSQGRNLFLRSVANKLLPGQATILDGTTIPSGVGVINRTNAAGQVIGVTQVREFDIINGTAQCGSIVCKPFAEVDYKTSGGSDSYNAFQMSLSRRFDTGLTMNLQYTLARSFGNTSGSNEARTSAELDNFEADRGYNNFDVRQTFNISALYALPFGKGKTYLSDVGSLGNALLGNWEVGGIINARSGVPIEVNIVRPDVVMQCGNSVLNLPGTISGASPLPTGCTAVVNTPGGGNSRNIRRPDIVPGVNPYLNNDRSFINPAAFATPAPGTFGNLPRNALKGPGFAQFDMVFNKRFPIRERMNVEFRTEIFNIFNHTNFANPAATLNNALGTLQPGQPFTQAAAGATFGLLRSTVERTVGLGTQRQIQFALRLNF
jgi:Carboxypeptidase regulatory-like domain